MFMETEEERRRRLQKLFLGGQGAVAAGAGDTTDSALSGPLGLRRVGPSVAMKIDDIRAQAQAAPVPSAVEKLMGSRKTKAEMDELRANGVPEEKGFWRRLGSGALKGLRSYAEAGPEARSLGIGGLLGAIAGGGISSAASPKLHSEWTRDRKLGQLMGRYGGEMAVEGAEEKRQQDMLKTVQEGIDLQTKGVDLRQKIAKPYMETALLKDHMTDEEIATASNMLGIQLPKVIDKGDYKDMEINGEHYTRRGSSSKWVKNTSLPASLKDQPIQTEIPGTGGKKLPLLPGQTASMQAQIQSRNVAAETQAQRDARAAAEKRATEDAKNMLKIGEKGDKLKGAQDKLASLQRTWEGASTEAQKVTIAKEIADTRAIIGEMESAVKRGAVAKTKGVKSASNLPTEADARAELARRGNMTPEQIEAAIQAAKARKAIR